MKRTLLLSLLAVMMIVCTQCKKDPEAAEKIPSILSFSPASASAGETVTLKGANFSNTLTSNKVQFSGVDAEVITATEKQLEVKVPANVVSGKITVRIDTRTATSLTEFIRMAYLSTIAGKGERGFTEGQGIAAQFNSATDLAFDAAGNMYVTDSGNRRIRKITPSGLVSTFAGSGVDGFQDGAATEAKFGELLAIDIDKAGNLYVADTGNSRIRKITPAGIVSTLAGSSFGGYAEGDGKVARFSTLLGIAVDASGNVFVTDAGNYRVRKVTPAGIVSTYAGDGIRGYVDGRAARFDRLLSIHVDALGNLFVTDGNQIRKISPDGLVSTLAGRTVTGFQDGSGSTAMFSNPFGLTSDAAGNIYIGDQGNSRVRKITPRGEVSTYAGSGVSGYADGPVNIAQMKSANGMKMLPSGELFFVDNQNSRIRKVTP
jgi:sugar lactone lactonase YvrE